MVPIDRESYSELCSTNFALVASNHHVGVTSLSSNMISGYFLIQRFDLGRSKVNSNHKGSVLTLLQAKLSVGGQESSVR